MAKFDSKICIYRLKIAIENDLPFFLHFPLSLSLSSLSSHLSLFRLILVLPSIKWCKCIFTCDLNATAEESWQREWTKIDLLCLMAYWIFQYILRTIPFSTTHIHTHISLISANPAAQNIHFNRRGLRTILQHIRNFDWKSCLFFFCASETNTFAGSIANGYSICGCAF